MRFLGFALVSRRIAAVVVPRIVVDSAMSAADFGRDRYDWWTLSAFAHLVEFVVLVLGGAGLSSPLR